MPRHPPESQLPESVEREAGDHDVKEAPTAVCLTCFTGKWAPQASGHLMPRPTQSILLMYELYNIIYKLHIKHSLAGFGTFEPCAQMNNKRYNEAVLAFVAPEVVAR